MTPMRHAEYLSCAETAKLVRLALRHGFPAVRFSVRSKTYSGGASITVRWQGGPTAEEVESVVRPFEGAEFDGMIDLKAHRDHWLTSDGRAIIAFDPGTRSSGGVLPSVENPPPELDARLVSFGADFIFCERRTP